MQTQITVTLSLDEKEALRTLAKQEYRDTRAQAALIIRQALEQSGLLTSQKPLKTQSQQEARCVS